MKKKLYTSIGVTMVICIAAIIASVSIFAADSGWKNPSNNSSSGVTNPTNAYTQDGSEAVFDSSSDAATYYDYSFAVPAGAQIDGIEVRADVYRESRGNTDLSVRLYDGASAVGNTKTIDSGSMSSSESNNYITLGSASDKWGATWNSTSANNLRVRLTVSDRDRIYLDNIQVKITYTEKFDVTFREGSHGTLGTNPSVQSILKGGNATAPTTTDATGYYFDKWVLTSDLTTVVSDFTNINANLDVTAQYKKCEYPVIFYEGLHGTLVGDNLAGDADANSGMITRLVEYQDDASVPVVTPDLGWKFIGWEEVTLLITAEQANAQGEVGSTLYPSDDVIFTNITESMAFAAIYEQIDYTVKFESNGGTAVADQILHYEDKVTEPAAILKDGNTFGGWYKDAALTTPWNFSTDVVTGDTTLYAKWTPIVVLPKTGEFGMLFGALGSLTAGAGLLVAFRKKDQE